MPVISLATPTRGQFIPSPLVCVARRVPNACTKKTVQVRWPRPTGGRTPRLSALTSRLSFPTAAHLLRIISPTAVPSRRPPTLPAAHWISSESGDVCSVLCDAAIIRPPLKHPPRLSAQTNPATLASTRTHAPTRPATACPRRLAETDNCPHTHVHTASRSVFFHRCSR